MPIAESALAESVTKLSSEKSDLSNYEGDYKQWREAFDAGQARIWKLPLAKCIAAMEEIINK